jgi:hypothetical protein
MKKCQKLTCVLKKFEWDEGESEELAWVVIKG